MKKKDIAEKIAIKNHITNQAAENIVNQVFNEISSALANREDVKIFGFGKFITREYNVRKCYNPITGEINTVKASVQPVFKAGRVLKEVLNDKI